MMKGKNNGGFSLVEILVAMAILASVVIPVCSSMLVSVRINAKAEAVLKARLAVSSAVEKLRAEGYADGLSIDGVNITLDTEQPSEPRYYYNIVVEDTNQLVKVETSVRAAESEEAGDPE